MKIIRARYRSGADMMAHYLSSAEGGIFFPTRDGPAPGTPVIVEMSFPELVDRVLVRGVVAWRRPGRRIVGEAQPGGRLRAGVGIEFLAGEQPARDFLLAAARGDVAATVVQRNHRRLPISMSVDWRVKEERSQHTSTIGDIGAGGAFIRTRDVQPEGTPVVLDVVPPGSEAALSIEGRVAWVRATPGGEGLGVAFRCRDTGGLRRLKELVRRLAAAEAA
jgi:uncharacterized protein (TIGR02266 family)